MVVQQVVVQYGLRHRLYRQMEPSARGRPGLSIANAIVVAIVVLSFVLFALETEPSIRGEARVWIVRLNFAVLVAFAIEYVIRLWVAGEHPPHAGFAGRLRYAFSLYALADLAAFLPELVWLLMPHGGDDSVLMFMRVLRLVRILKITHFVPAFGVFGAAMRRAGTQLLTAAAVALGLVFVSAVLLYFIEGVGEGRAEFGSIPRSLWWAISALTTVGYGDIYPVTVPGKIAASLIAFAGIGVVALPAGIFASAFSDELRERDKARLRSAAVEAGNVSEMPAAGQSSANQSSD